MIRALTLLLAALAATLALAGSASAACTPARNVELMIDDSGSMGVYDYPRKRVDAAKLLLAKAANRGRVVYGALEFATSARNVFLPRPVGRRLDLPFQRLERSAAGNGSGAALANGDRDEGLSTDYDSAFLLAGRVNPAAQARVFLTDGDHTRGRYDNTHRGGPPTHVVGFGSSSRGAGRELLERIATETGGRSRLSVGSRGLTRAVDSLDRRLSCTRGSRSLRRRFVREGQSRAVGVRLGRRTRSVEITLLWQGSDNRFAVTRVAGPRGRRLRVRRRRGRTFQAVRVRGTGRARRLRFTVKARRLSDLGMSVSAVVAQSRGR